MRLTPAQIAVRLICGNKVRRKFGESLHERIQQGHDLLTSITGEDFGYDLEAWHNHLQKTRKGGYTYGRCSALPRLMQAALKSSDWRDAVQSLKLRCI